MLILSRKVGESILIYPEYLSKEMTVEEMFSNGELEVNIHSVQGRQVKLAFNAPDKIAIMRRELLYREKRKR